MRVWVFSDLHLEASDLYHDFLQLLDREVEAGDEVVFAGDIFDVFVGSSRHFLGKFSGFFEVLRRLRQRGAKLHYIFGNHDFNLESAFQGLDVDVQDAAVELDLPAPDATKRLHVAHGDLIDESDLQYRRMRKLFRSPPVRLLSAVLPGRWIEDFGAAISRKSDQKAADLPESWTPERRNALRKLYRDYAAAKHRQGFDFVILGHCHDLDELPPFYWNMGYPPVHRRYLRYDSATGSVARHQFPGIPRKS